MVCFRASCIHCLRSSAAFAAACLAPDSTIPTAATPAVCHSTHTCFPAPTNPSPSTLSTRAIKLRNCVLALPQSEYNHIGALAKMAKAFVIELAGEKHRPKCTRLSTAMVKMCHVVPCLLILMLFLLLCILSVIGSLHIMLACHGLMGPLTRLILITRRCPPFKG